MTIVRHDKTFVESSREMRTDLDYSKHPLRQHRHMVVGPTTCGFVDCLWLVMLL